MRGRARGGSPVDKAHMVPLAQVGTCALSLYGKILVARKGRKVGLSAGKGQCPMGHTLLMAFFSVLPVDEFS